VSGFSRTTPALAGLLVAWGGTALLVTPAAVRMLDSTVTGRVLGQAAMWLLFAAVVTIVVRWERQPLSSLWLRPFQWQSVAWAAALVAAHIVILFPATEWIRAAAGLPGYAAGMATFLESPVWLRVISVVTAGVVEETLFHGFAVTRLTSLTGRLWLAVVVASAVFAALHLPFWGPGPSLAFFLGGLATTAFFAWRRDLLAMIVFHVATDAWGMVITPLFTRWWN
jgi:membrane protease YdiL (CAAX protease family)